VGPVLAHDPYPRHPSFDVLSAGFRRSSAVSPTLKTRRMQIIDHRAASGAWPHRHWKPDSCSHSEPQRGKCDHSPVAEVCPSEWRFSISFIYLIQGNVSGFFGGGRDALEGGGVTPSPPLLQGAQPTPSHFLPDAKCQLQWRL
jgi:hypothetical protein